jgi:hypothetical protein
MQRAPILAATGLAICMLLAACGGDEPELSKAEFVKQADAICAAAQKQMSKKLASEPESIYGQTNPKSPIYPLTAEALETEADEIDALGAPSADADQVEAIIEGARQVATTLGESEGGRDEGKVEKATSQMPKVEKLASDYGLKSCLLS